MGCRLPPAGCGGAPWASPSCGGSAPSKELWRLSAPAPQPCLVLTRCWREPAGGTAAEAKMEWEEGKVLPGELL